MQSPTTPPPKEIPEERAIFARKFKAAREAAGLSQREIHRRTGLAQSYISGVERCTENISLDTMARLATLVGLPLHELLTP